MVRMFIRHRVGNYGSWRNGYDALEAAQALASSDELKQAMASAGVVGVPDVWLASPA